MKLLTTLVMLALVTNAFGMTKRHFIRVIEAVEKVYAPIVKEYGGELILYSGWQFDSINALAKQYDEKFIVEIYGGLGRHPLLSDDGLRLTVCHEIGHHIAGAPKKLSDDGSERWSSAEAQCDYFATSECLPKVFKDLGDTDKVVARFSDELKVEVSKVCESNICKRIVAAGISVAKTFGSRRKPAIVTNVDTPVTTYVDETELEYPSLQCRLDTYVNGALGLERPACWFAN